MLNIKELNKQLLELYYRYNDKLISLQQSNSDFDSRVKVEMQLWVVLNLRQSILLDFYGRFPADLPEYLIEALNDTADSVLEKEGTKSFGLGVDVPTTVLKNRLIALATKGIGNNLTSLCDTINPKWRVAIAQKIHDSAAATHVSNSDSGSNNSNHYSCKSTSQSSNAAPAISLSNNKSSTFNKSSSTSASLSSSDSSSTSLSSSDSSSTSMPVFTVNSSNTSH